METHGVATVTWEQNLAPHTKPPNTKQELDDTAERERERS